MISDSPPPEEPFRTEEAAYEAIRIQQFQLGFVTSKARTSGRDRHGFNTYVEVRCQSSGTYKPVPNVKGRYKTSTKKTDCPFFTKIRFNRSGNCYQCEIISDNHNHDPIDDLIGASRHRRYTQEKFGVRKLKDLVKERSKSSSTTAREVARLISAEHPEVEIIDEDVHLIRREIRLQEYGPYTATQAFLRLLKEDKRIFYYDVDRDEYGRLCRFFWVYEDHLVQWKKNAEVLLMDNTYKVNRFNLPLFEITGVTALNTNFNCGYCLAAREDTGTFTWILTRLKIVLGRAEIAEPAVVLTDFDQALKKALSEVFSETQQQLCFWHIMKNVAMHCKKKWLGSLEDCETAGHSEEDTAREVNGIDADFTPSPHLELESLAARDEDDVEENAALIATRLTTTLDDDFGLQKSVSSRSRKFEDLSDGIIAAWKSVARAPTERQFFDNWDTLCREFPNQKGKSRSP